MLTLMNLSPYSDYYSHFKLYWKTFSAPTRIIAINTSLNLNLNDYKLGILLKNCY